MNEKYIKRILFE